MVTRSRASTSLSESRGLSLFVFGLGTTAVTAGAVGQTIRFGDPMVYRETYFLRTIRSADFDRDADVDVAVALREEIHLYFNDGAGALIQESIILAETDINFLAAADMDADEDVDLIWFDRLPDHTRVLSIWYNSGDGRTGEVVQTPFAGYGYADLVVGDVNDDGYADVLFESDQGTLSVFINGGDRSFNLQDVFTHVDPQYELQAVVTGDFDGDGDTDLVATFQYVYYNRYGDVKGTDVVLLINKGEFPFELQSVVEPDWQRADLVAFDMVAGDLDGDGDLDVSVAGSNARNGVGTEFVILENDDGRSFSQAATHRVADGRPGDLAIADIDTDGRLDLVFVTGAVRGVYVLRNDGDFVLSGMSPFYTSCTGDGVEVADLDGDGQYDVLHLDSLGFAVIQNITTLLNPTLRVSSLVRGEEARFVVDAARPGEEVHYLYTLHGTGSTPGYHQLGGMTLDLNRPRMLGKATASGDGRAIFRRRLPPDAPLVPASFQAVIRRGPGGRNSVKTPFQIQLVME